MTTSIIARVNNVDIVSTSDEQKLVPIKPICEALGIDDKSQRNRIDRDEILSSTGVMTTLVAADGKEREMFCLPLEYIFGWLFSIDHERVSEDSKAMVLHYKRECYHALFLHFTARAQFVEQKQIEIDRQLSIVDDAKDHFRNAKNVLSDAETKLKQLRSLTMDDYDIESRQLKLDF